MASYSMAQTALARELACISRDQSAHRAGSDPRPRPHPSVVWQPEMPTAAGAAHRAPPAAPPGIDSRKFRRRYILAWRQLGGEP